PAAMAAHTNRMTRIVVSSRFPLTSTGEPGCSGPRARAIADVGLTAYESGTAYSAGGGERPLEPDASSASSASCSTVVAKPAAVSRDAPGTGRGCGSEPS